MQDISQMNVENIVSRCSSMFWSGWYVGLCVCLSLSLCVLLFSASSLLTVVAHLSVCLVQLPHTTAAGLLLWAGRAGNIDWLLQQWRANVGSATLSAYVHWHWYCDIDVDIISDIVGLQTVCVWLTGVEGTATWRCLVGGRQWEPVTVMWTTHSCWLTARYCMHSTRPPR